jgi:hypothetical protein
MIKYEIEHKDNRTQKWVVVAYQPCLGGHLSCGEVVYASRYIIDAEQTRDRLILDQDPMFQKYVLEQEAYAFEECFV